MKKIVINTKSIVNKTLNEKRKSNLNESFIPLRKIKNQDVYLEECFKTSIKLLNEGYTENEVNQQLVKEFELPTSLGLDKIDWKSFAKESGGSYLREMAINWILKFIGISPGWSTTLSQAFADMNPLDLVRIFKDGPTCNQHAPHIMDAVIEVSLRAGVSELFDINRNNDGWSGVPASLMGNITGEAIRKSGLGESITAPFCKLIHK
jgi:hypothetical protein